mmetsp:Transcript_55827/g.145181  ORF Transcript_55827/g.145181 Transcript_55827/m.145181 type:complete len:440 (-) Transcript_55827:509-1828(-)
MQKPARAPCGRRERATATRAACFIALRLAARGRGAGCHVRSADHATDLLQLDLGLPALALGAEHLQLRAREQDALGLVGEEAQLCNVGCGLRLHSKQSGTVAASSHKIPGDALVRGAAGDSPPDDRGTHLVLGEEVHADAAPQGLLPLREPVAGLEQQAQVWVVFQHQLTLLVAQSLVQLLVDGVRGVEEDRPVHLWAYRLLWAASLLLVKGIALGVAALDVARLAHVLRGVAERLGHWQLHDAIDRYEVLLAAQLFETHAQVELHQRLLRAEELGGVDGRRQLGPEVVRYEGVVLRRDGHQLRGARVLPSLEQRVDLVQHRLPLLHLFLGELAQGLVAPQLLHLALHDLARVTQRPVLHVHPDEEAWMHHEVVSGVPEGVARPFRIQLREHLNGLVLALAEFLYLGAALVDPDAAPFPEDPVLEVALVVRLQEVHDVE